MIPEWLASASFETPGHAAALFKSGVLEQVTGRQSLWQSDERQQDGRPSFGHSVPSPVSSVETRRAGGRRVAGHADIRTPATAALTSDQRVSRPSRRTTNSWGPSLRRWPATRCRGSRGGSDRVPRRGRERRRDQHHERPGDDGACDTAARPRGLAGVATVIRHKLAAARRHPAGGGRQPPQIAAVSALSLRETCASSRI